MAQPLITKAIIQAVDKFTGPMRGMAKAAAEVNAGMTAQSRIASQYFNRLGQTMEGVGKHLTSRVTLPVAASIAMIVASAQEANKAMLGIQLGMLSPDDNTPEKIAKVRAEYERLSKSMRLISQETGVDLALIAQAGEAAVKMGLDPRVVSTYAKSAARMNMADPSFTPVAATEFLGTMSRLFNFSGDPETNSKQARIEADRATLAANLSRASLSTLAEGLGQFAGIATSSGMSPARSEGMLAALTNMGVNPIVAGQTIKSDLVRAINPTMPGLRALEAANIKRASFMDLSQADPQKTVTMLGSQFKGLLSKDEKLNLTRYLTDGKRKGLFEDPKFLDGYFGRLYKFLDARSAADRSDIQAAGAEALVKAGGKIDLAALIKQIATLPEALQNGILGQYFIGDRIDANRRLVASNGEADKFTGQLGRVDGGYLDRIQGVRDDSSFGRMERMKSAWSNLSNAVSESPAIARFIEQMTGLVNAFNNASPAMQQFALNGALIAAAAGPLLRVGGALLRVGAAAAGAGRLLGISGANIRLLGGALAGGKIPEALKLMTGSFSLLKFAVRGTAITGGIMLLIEHFDKLQAFASGFSTKFSEMWGKLQASPEMQKFAENMSKLGERLGAVWNALMSPLQVIAEKVAYLIGVDTSQSSLGQFFQAGEREARGLLIILEGIVTAINTVAAFIGSAGPYAAAGAGTGPSTRFGPMPDLFGSSPSPMRQGPAFERVKPMEDWEIGRDMWKRASDAVVMPPQKVEVQVKVLAPDGYGAITTVSGDAKATAVRTGNDPGH